MLEILFRLQPAAGHQRIGDADGCGGFELYCDVELIILLQKRAVNVVEDVLPVVEPVFIRQLPGNAGQLLGQIRVCHAVLPFQHGGNRDHMLRLHGPQPGAAGIGSRSGVGDIKDIAQAGTVPGIVHQGDAFGAAPDIPAHFFIPQVIFRTGGGVRALGVDQQLFVVGVLIKPGCRGQKRRPFLPAGRQPDRRLICDLCELFCLIWHGVVPPFGFGIKKGQP